MIMTMISKQLSVILLMLSTSSLHLVLSPGGRGGGGGVRAQGVQAPSGGKDLRAQRGNTGIDVTDSPEELEPGKISC